MTNLKYFKKYILSMTFVDWFCLIVDLTLVACSIIFTFYFGVEVGRALGA